MRRRNKGQERAPEKKGKRRRIIFSLGVKTAVVITLMIVIYTIVSVYSAHGALARITRNEKLYSIYALGRTLAIAADQAVMTDLFDQTREIYDAIPEEDRTDPLDPAYLAHFAEFAEDPEVQDFFSRLTKTVRENNLWWVALTFDDDTLGRTITVMDTDPRDDGRYTMGWWEETREYEIGSAYVSVDASNEIPFDAIVDPNTGTASIDIAYRTIVAPNDRSYVIVNAPFYRYGTREVIGHVVVAKLELMMNAEVTAFIAVYGVSLLFLGILFILLGYVMIRRMVVRPVKKLTKAATSYMNHEDMDAESHVFGEVQVRTHDEIRLLSDTMKQMETEISDYMRDIKAETAARERISTELDVASRIQKTLLPTALSGWTGPESFALSSFMAPAREVGGDFYDYFVIDDDHIGIAIADVSGKGVPASLFMVITRTMVKGEALEKLTPGTVLQRVNQRIMENNEEMMFVTVWFGIYTVSERRLVYVNAGHEDTALYRANEGRYRLIEEPHDIALGVLEDYAFTEQELTLAPGDRLFLYTDGIPEATASDDRRYGTERMLDCLNAHSAEDGQAIMAALQRDVEVFTTGEEQYDDMTMVCFDIRE